MQQPWKKILCSDGIQWIGKKVSPYYPDNFEDAATIDIYSLVLQSEFDFISYVYRVYELLIKSIESEDDRYVDQVKEIQSNIEDIRNICPTPINKDVIEMLKREFHESTRGQLLWFITCYCNAYLSVIDKTLLQNQIEKIESMRNIFFAPLGILMFKNSFDHYTISMLVLQIRCLATHWKRLVYNENLIILVLALESIVSYYVTSSGSSRNFDDDEWCEIVNENEDKDRPLYTSNQSFLMFTEIHFRLFKQAITTFFNVVPNRRRPFIIDSVFKINMHANNMVIECKKMNSEAYERYMDFMKRDILSIASNKKFIELFSFEAIDKMVPLGMDEYRFFTNKRRTSNSISLISEFQSGLRAKNIKTFIRQHFIKFYPVGESRKTKLSIYDVIADVLVIRCFNAFLHSHSFIWQPFFVQFENNTIMPKKSYTVNIRDTNDEFKNQDEHSRLFDSSIAKKFPRIIQRFNWYDVDFHMYTWTCVRSIDAIFIWLYFVHRCLNGCISNFDISFITEKIFIKE